MDAPPHALAARVRSLVLLLALSALSCGSPRAIDPPDAGVSALSASGASPSTLGGEDAGSGAIALDAAAPDAAVDASAAAVAPGTGQGKDFREELAMLFRVAACGNDEPLPAGLDAAVVKAHCDELVAKIESYKKRYVSVAKPFLSELQPKGLPDAVVYPFGGGDLVTALTTYPDARDITTISLELAGDPRRIRKMSKGSLTRSLRQLRMELGELIFLDFSNSDTLKKTQRGDIPGEIGLFLVGLAVHGFEPVGLRYFHLEPDGSIHYLSEAEVDANESTIATHKKDSWTPPDFSAAFANVEITFRPKGAPASEPLRVHRHIAENLGDARLSKDPSLLRHLEKKGRVRAMTKAASYLLWRDNFSLIRDYLLGNMDFMISDSTGIPPSISTKAGFTVDTYGTFQGSFVLASTEQNIAFIRFWKKQPARNMPFTYGYTDSSRKDHLMVTRKGEPPKAP
jgi:hypothetical protein